jgi:hypothetical protein
VAANDPKRTLGGPKSRVGKYGISTARIRLVRLDVGRPDHLAPLLGILGDELAEVGGRARKHGSAQVSKPRLHRGISEPRIDFPVERIDDFRRSVLGCTKAEPPARLVAGTNSPTVGMSGSTSERFAERRRPWLGCVAAFDPKRTLGCG